MSWIAVVQFGDATGVLAGVYERQAATLGRPTQLTMLGSLYPELAAIRSELYDVVESCPSSLTPVERQAIALVVTGALGSDFLTSGVRSKFIAVGGDDALASDLTSGVFIGLPLKARALCSYALLVAVEPSSIQETDLEACRAVGASDLDILDANSLASYYAYLARVCLGLGLHSPV
ncbi:MAG: hypothetical protein M5U23_04930 [Acidimicrobiia bacterium]|nr:hypothetical protein [Acidimicrobiia bacterium]